MGGEDVDVAVEMCAPLCLFLIDLVVVVVWYGVLCGDVCGWGALYI